MQINQYGVYLCQLKIVHILIRYHSILNELFYIYFVNKYNNHYMLMYIIVQSLKKLTAQDHPIYILENQPTQNTIPKKLHHKNEYLYYSNMAMLFICGMNYSFKIIIWKSQLSTWTALLYDTVPFQIFISIYLLQWIFFY